MLAIVGISILLERDRGLVREVLALAAWVVAFLAANLLRRKPRSCCRKAMASEEIRLLAGFVVVFVVVLIAIERACDNGLQAGKNRRSRAWRTALLGGVFGLVRGRWW